MKTHLRWWTMLLSLILTLTLRCASASKDGDATLESEYSARDFFMQLTGLGGDNKAQVKDMQQENIKLLGAGFSRTGTTSLSLALAHIGYNAYDLNAAVPLGHMQLIKKAFTPEESAAAVRELREEMLTNGFNATLDIPMSLLWKELRELEPDAKVLLSVRDSAEDWVKSYVMLLNVFAPMVGIPFTKLVDFSAAYLFEPRMGCISMHSYWTPWYLPWIHFMYKSEVDAEDCMNGYNAWIQEAKDVLPKDQLLIFNVKQGWEPLCKFLGKPIPEIPFPRVNTKSDIALGWYAMRIIALTYPFLLLLPLLLLYCVARCCCCRKSKKKAKEA